MISWIWLIPTAFGGAIIGTLFTGWLTADKIADLEDALWASQMSWENPLPFLDVSPKASFDDFLGKKEEAADAN